MLKGARKEPHKPKQAAVIQAAAELFVQHGYDGASTEMIAERAGVSRQTIYNQFASKEALFLAVAADLVGEIATSLGEALEGAGDLRNTLLKLGRGILTPIMRPKTIAFYRVVITEAPRFPELARAVHEVNSVAVDNEVAAYLEKQAQLLVPDPKLAARHFVALVIHPFSFQLLLGIGANADAPEIGRHLEAAVDAFLRAYGKPKTSVSR